MCGFVAMRTGAITRMCVWPAVAPSRWSRDAQALTSPPASGRVTIEVRPRPGTIDVEHPAVPVGPGTRARHVICAAAAGCALLAGGCGDGDRVRPQERMVTGSVRLERAEAGPPDAGAMAGHGADAARGATSRSWFSFAGTVSPADSVVTLRDPRRRARATVRVTGSGRFTATIRGLALGLNRLSLAARKPGHTPWEIEIRVVRRAR